MPLLQSASPESLAANIRQLMSEGYSREQATAIALDIQRRARSRSRLDSAAQERARRTAQLLAAARLAGRKRRKRPVRRLPRQVGQKALEREYGRYLLSVVRRTEEALQPVLERLPDLLASARAARERQDENEGEQARAALGVIRERLRRAFDPRAELARLASRASTLNRAQLLRQVRAVFGTDVFLGDQGLAAIVDGFAAENVTLIRDLPNQIISDVEKSTTRALSSGTLHKDLAKELESRFGFARNRARLIARDQMGKLYGEINAQRQRSLGVQRFVWRTVGDERVRDEHQDREGETFRYSAPPDGELPGQPINCRCYAEPVFDEILAEIE